MKKLLSFFSTSLIAVTFAISLAHAESSLSKPEPSKPLVIGIVLPMEHAALNDVVHGFEQQMKSAYNGPVTYSVQNAHGDMNIQRAILQQFEKQNVAIVVPVGTAATQMALVTNKNQPIVSLACLCPTQLPNMTGVRDEVNVETQLNFIHQFDSNVKKITLVYSNSEKVFDDVEKTVTVGKQLGIQVQKLMIQALPDLYTVSKAIDKDSNAIFILKDHLIVNGIQTLAREAEKLHIPVITSDEGSIKSGGSFALSVREQSIGEQGALLAAKILQGADVNTLPIENLQALTVFANIPVLTKADVDVEKLEKQAKTAGYGFSAVQ